MDIVENQPEKPTSGELFLAAQVANQAAKVALKHARLTNSFAELTAAEGHPEAAELLALPAIPAAFESIAAARTFLTELSTAGLLVQAAEERGEIILKAQAPGAEAA